jgi:hypothetical protein
MTTNNILTKANYNDQVDIVLSKICKVSPNKEGKENGLTKTINVEISYKNLTFRDIMAKALKSDIIAYQNGNARKNFAKLTNNEVVKINAASPGANYVDPEEKTLEDFPNKSPEEQRAFIKKLETMIAGNKK